MAKKFSPISDYALIGDCHGSALVARDGAIDWCALARFDADPVFCRLLDLDLGGALWFDWSETPGGSRAYLGETNILETTFDLPRGRLRVTDFMPVGRVSGAAAHDYASLAAPHWLVRVVRCDEGRAQVRLCYRPTEKFGLQPARPSVQNKCVRTERTCLSSDLAFRLEGDVAVAEFDLAAGEQRVVVVAPGPVAESDLAKTIARYFDITRAFWREWSEYCSIEGRYRDSVLRSALVLKLLTYAPTGALVAAPTTSLPEQIGGARNWDYRFCWPRDSAFMLYALALLGYHGAGNRFADFLLRACRVSQPGVQVMYGIEHETQLTEHDFDHLTGYGNSKPVRVGNAAFSQHQLDVYGEILEWAQLHYALGGELAADYKPILTGLGRVIERQWSQPDQGLWEMRGPPRHHAFGKVMSWVGLDRLDRLYGPTDDRRRVEEAIHRALLTDGLDTSGRRIVGTFGTDDANAALLRIPMLGIPLPPDVVTNTIEAIQNRLQHDEFVRRYDSDDGLSGDEGAFFVCSFWLVDALVAIDRADEARELFERLLARGNDLGLFSEEVDAKTGAMLGNFPQGLTHLALIQNALNLELHSQHGAAAARGPHFERARYHRGPLGSVTGLRSRLELSYRSGRITSSRASIMR